MVDYHFVIEQGHYNVCHLANAADQSSSPTRQTEATKRDE